MGRTPTKRFEDLNQALREGYHISGPYVPGMGWHMTNPDYVAKTAEQGPSPLEPPGRECGGRSILATIHLSWIRTAKYRGGKTYCGSSLVNCL